MLAALQAHPHRSNSTFRGDEQVDIYTSCMEGLVETNHSSTPPVPSPEPLQQLLVKLDALRVHGRTGTATWDYSGPAE